MDDINKGDASRTKYRSWQVAKEFKVDVRPDLFAANPPQNAFDCYYLYQQKIKDKRYYMSTSVSHT